MPWNRDEDSAKTSPIKAAMLVLTLSRQAVCCCRGEVERRTMMLSGGRRHTRGYREWLCVADSRIELARFSLVGEILPGWDCLHWARPNTGSEQHKPGMQWGESVTGQHGDCKTVPVWFICCNLQFCCRMEQGHTAATEECKTGSGSNVACTITSKCSTCWLFVSRKPTRASKQTASQTTAGA
jgi:hypothetical protein